MADFKIEAGSDPSFVWCTDGRCVPTQEQLDSYSEWISNEIKSRSVGAKHMSCELDWLHEAVHSDSGELLGLKSLGEVVLTVRIKDGTCGEVTYFRGCEPKQESV